MTTTTAMTTANIKWEGSSLALSEDDTLLPHAFERLWGALATQGEFQTRVTEAVPQSAVVRHLCDRGFQVHDEERRIRVIPVVNKWVGSIFNKETAYVVIAISVINIES